MMKKLSPWFFGLGIVFFLCFVVFKLYIGGWVPFFTLSLALSLIFLCLGFVAQFKELKVFFQRKTTRHGLQMGIVMLMAMGAYIGANALSYKYHKTWDLTTDEVNTLSPPTQSLLNSLKSSVHLLFFYQKGVESNEENRREFRELARKYQDLSSKIDLQFIEVNEKPEMAKKYGVDEGSGVAFAEYLDRRSRIDKITEQELTNAIVRATLEKELKIYVTSGHRERSWEQAKEPQGLNSLKLLLQNSRMQIFETRLSESKSVPTDCDLLIIAGPKTDFDSIEVAALNQYLEKGGSILLALENEDTPRLYEWAGQQGFKIERQLVMNLVKVSGQDGVNEGPTYASQFSSTSPVTKLMTANDSVSFLHPMSFNFEKVPDEVAYEIVAQTSPSAISFADLEMNKQLKVDSFSLAGSVEGKKGKAKYKVMLVTDVDFLSNAFLFQHLNREFIMGSMAYLTDLNQLNSISQKIPEMTPLFLTPTKLTSLVLFIYVPLPLVMLGFGIYFLNRRRKS